MSKAAVEERLAERAAWVSYDEAGRIIGCHPSTITEMVHAARLVSTAGQVARSQPTLERASVERVAAEVEQERAEQRRQTKRAEQEAAKRRSSILPPDDEHAWIGAPAAAELLGVHLNTVRNLADAEKRPLARVGQRRWFGRDQLQLVANARAAQTTYLSPSRITTDRSIVRSADEGSSHETPR